MPRSRTNTARRAEQRATPLQRRGAWSGALLIGAGLGLAACHGAEPPASPSPPSPPTASTPLAQGPNPDAWRAVQGSLPRGSAPLPNQGHLAGVRCLAFSPDGRLLVSGSDDGSLMVRDVESGAIVQRFDGHRRPVESCVFLPGDRVISGGYEDFSRMWDAISGQEIRAVGVLAHPGESTSALAVSATGRDLLLSTSSGRVKVEDLDTDWERFRADEYARSGPIKGPLVAAGYLSDGRFFTGGYNAGTIVWVMISVGPPATRDGARGAPSVQRIERPASGTWSKGKTASLSVQDLRWDRGAQVTLRACAPGAACGPAVELELPPPKSR